MDQSFNYVFVAIRGVQAGREYYTAMCPMKLIPKIFLFDEDELMPELRAQRILNKTRIPELAHYIISNPKDYVFSSITASIDGDVTFKPYEGNPSVGLLSIPMNSRFLINDGQHRRAAIEEALKQKAELGDETISVVFFIDTGLKRSQQMFADLNTHAIRATKSIGILYDHRDSLSQVSRQIVKDIPCFKELTEVEKTSISNRSRKLFTLSSIYHATARLLGKSFKTPILPAEADRAKEFWNEVVLNMDDWQAALTNTVSSAELRQDYVHAHGVALQAIAVAGHALIKAKPKDWKPVLKKLNDINWKRSNVKDWEGRALIGGRLSKAHVNVLLTSNLIKQHLGLPLLADEMALEKNRE